MNEEHLNEWLTELRSGTRQQARATLIERTLNGGHAFCCLGVGSVLAGCPIDEPAGTTFATGIRFGPFVRGALPGREFLDWLGIETDPDINEFNIPLKCDFRDLVEVFGDLSLDDDYHRGNMEGHQVYLTYLNDHGFTFPMIADAIEKFGIHEDFLALSLHEQHLHNQKNGFGYAEVAR